MTEQENRLTPDPTILTTEQLLREVERVKELMMAELKGMNAVFAERFSSIGTQLALIERQRVEQKTDTATAVQAALSAAKEAVKEQTAASEKSILKTENSTGEQLKQLIATFTIANEGLKSQADDLKERVAKIESIKEGRGEAYGGIYAAIAGVGGLLGIVIWAAGSGVFNG